MKYEPLTHEEVLLLQEALAKKPLFFRIEISVILLMIGFIMVLIVSLTDLGRLQTSFFIGTIVVIVLVAIQFWKNYQGRANLCKDLIHREKRLTRVKLTKKEKRFAPSFQLLYLADRKTPIIVDKDFYESVERGQYFDIWRSRFASESLTDTIRNSEGETTSLDRILTEQVLQQAQRDWQMSE